jgi:hypothetical protein
MDQEESSATSRALVDSVRSREDLAQFISQLHAQLLAGSTWENHNLASFLEALSAWINDSPGYFRNRGEPVPAEASWSYLAQALLAATAYE